MKYLLLILPCIVALSPFLYNVKDPALFGMPFFYWFQLLLVPLSAIATYTVDRQSRS